MYVVYRNELLARIQSSLHGRQASQLSVAAHTLKSLLAIFHAEKGRRLALEIEHAANPSAGDTVDWTHCAQLIHALASEMDRLKPEMDRFVRGEQPA